MAEGWEHYFQPGETLLWEGAPKPGIYGWGKIIGLALFGLPFLVIGAGIGITGLGMVFGPTWMEFGLGFFMAAFSIPFVGVGVGLVFGLWFAASQAHRRIRYAVSTRCAYIAQSWWTRKIESYPILADTALGLEKGRRSDTVWFHVRKEKDSDGDRSTTRISFENIADGDGVYHLLRRVQTGLS